MAHTEVRLAKTLPFVKIALAAFILTASSAQSVAQHPLVGTWEMISVKGINADGEPFYLDTTSVRETKIITPTHYMLIAWDIDGDSLEFNRTMAGKVRLEGEKYIEIPQQASVQIFDNVDVNFKWTLEGDVFTQSGTIVRPDGKSVVLEALKFRRVKENMPDNQRNRAIGAWYQVSSECRTPQGERHSFFNAGDRKLLIVTPTHWMRMDHKAGEFSGVSYGTYTIKRDSVQTMVKFSTASSDGHTSFKQSVRGDRLQLESSGETGGLACTLHEVLEKAR